MWISIVWLFPSLLAVGSVGAALWTFLQLRWRLACLEERAEAGRRVLAASLEELQVRLGELEDDGPCVLPPGVGFTPAKRGHALRLIRRGESDETVSAALQLTAAEVELLRKVQAIIARQPGEPEARAMPPAPAAQPVVPSVRQ